MDQYEIEDTSDWLGCPTQLEMIEHYARMLEEDLHELKQQLRSAKENISGLVDMNDQQSVEIKKVRKWMANLEAEITELRRKNNSLEIVLNQKDRIIREIQAAELRP